MGHGRCFSGDGWGNADLRRLRRAYRAKLRRRFPKAEFGFAAGLQSQIDFSAGEIPEQQLLGRGIVAAGIEAAQQRGTLQPPGTKVETEINQRVELALGQSHLDKAADGALSRR